MNDADTQPTLLQRMGGVSGLIYSSLPSLVFVVVNAAAGLLIAVTAAVVCGVAVAVLRLQRREPFPSAVSGLLGVALAAFIAYRTGSANDYFLVGIWVNFSLAVVFFVSVLVRRPLVGVLWNADGRQSAGVAQRRTLTVRFRRRDPRPHGDVRGPVRGAELALWRRRRPDGWPSHGSPWDTRWRLWRSSWSSGRYADRLGILPRSPRPPNGCTVSRAARRCRVSGQSRSDDERHSSAGAAHRP